VKKQDIDTFRKLLLELRKRLEESVSHMQHEALEHDGANQNELSDMPLEHLADRGSDSFARDLMLGIIQDNEAEIIDIDRSLEKIDNDEYGICECCNGEIPEERLKAIPFARLCIHCKQEEEKQGK